jgi:hypothetical protein
MLKDAEGLIRTVERVDDALVAAHRGKVLPDIDTQIAKVQADLDGVKADSDLRNLCLYPLQQLKAQVGAQTSIAHIAQAARQAIELADTALDRIEAAATKPAPKKADGVGDQPSPKPVYVKPRRRIQAAALAPKELLETPEQVDAYLGTLREAMKKAIAEGYRVEVR